VRLGILPLGTVNVFARELRLPARLLDAWRVIEQGQERLVDVPQAEFVRESRPERRLFAQLAGAGLDSRAIELINWEYKKRLGPLAYVLAGFQAMAEAKTPIQVRAGSMTTQGELVLLGNGRLYGGNFHVFPRAELNDGLLDVTVFPKVNWATLLRSGWGLLGRDLPRMAGAQNFQAESIQLSAAGPLPFELDGDNVGHLPVTFSVQRSVLRVLTP
jgi:diacylglycerol kinase family enzyme